MSRYYEMEVTVTGVLEQFVEPVKKAIVSRPFDEDEILSEHDGNLNGVVPVYRVNARAEFNLCGGETEGDFARSLAGEIRNAAVDPVSIEIRCTYLDDPPTEYYTFEPGDEL